MREHRRVQTSEQRGRKICQPVFAIIPSSLKRSSTLDAPPAAQVDAAAESARQAKAQRDAAASAVADLEAEIQALRAKMSEAQACSVFASVLLLSPPDLELLRPSLCIAIA